MGPQTSGNRSLAALALGALLAALAGCSQEGTTPTCEDNVTKDGVLVNKVDNPCTPFAQCLVGDNVAPALQCCCPALSYVNTETNELVEFAVENGQCVNKDTDEVIPTDRYDLVQCRYGYGEIDLDSSGGAGAAGGSGGNGGSGGAGGG